VDDVDARLLVDNADVVARFRSGDRSALEDLVHLYAPRIARVVRSLTPAGVDVADLVQDVFVDVLGGLAGFRGESSLSTWMVSVAIRRCRRHRRWAWTRRHWLSAKAIDERDTPDHGAVDASLLLGEQGARVRQAVSRLPAKLREVVVLHYFESMEIAEIAKCLGMARSAVDMRLTRARAILRDVLGDERPEGRHG
jgi:RNA polymerase sigma-70 factor (ECF subfamily)